MVPLDDVPPEDKFLTSADARRLEGAFLLALLRRLLPHPADLLLRHPVLLDELLHDLAGLAQVVHLRAVRCFGLALLDGTVCRCTLLNQVLLLRAFHDF